MKQQTANKTTKRCKNKKNEQYNNKNCIIIKIAWRQQVDGIKTQKKNIIL